MAAARRQANEARLAAIEERLEKAEHGLSAVRKEGDRWNQQLQWVLEGSAGVEALYLRCFGPPVDGGWTTIKACLPNVLTQEAAEHLGVPFPLPKKGEQDGVYAGLSVFKKGCVDGLQKAYNALSVPGVIFQVRTQTGKGDEVGTTRRCPGKFLLILNPGEEGLAVAAVNAWGPGGHVDGGLRWASGKMAWGMLPPPPGQEDEWLKAASAEGEGDGEAAEGAGADAAPAAQLGAGEAEEAPVPEPAAAEEAGAGAEERDEAMEQAQGAPAEQKRMMIYHPKTYAERKMQEKGKAKGKGKDQNAKGKGKGNEKGGKGKVKGKGKGKGIGKGGGKGKGVIQP